MTLTNQSTSSQDLSQKVDQLEKLVQTISRSKAMWEATFDVISDPVVIINKHYQVLRANKALANACGMDIREVVGKKCYKIFAGFDEPCSHCPVADTLASSEQRSAELARFANQKQYVVNAYSAPSWDADEGESIVLHYRDVTDEKFLQQQLMQSEKMAAVGTLAGGVAHEINNPLGGILAFAQLVMKQLGDGHDSYGDLKEIEDAALRCKNIVRDLLDFSRSRPQEEMKPLSLNQVAAKTLSVLKAPLSKSDVEVSVEEHDIPMVCADFHKLQQVILNLATNSLHAMKGKPGKLKFSTGMNQSRNKVFLRVQDTGQGISKENLDRIFEPYFTTKDPGEGTGLGLAICYKIIQEHQGQIEIDSEVGVGTSVTLEFEPCS